MPVADFAPFQINPRRVWAWALGCWAGLALGAAAVEMTAREAFRERSWDADDGLPAAEIRAVARTPDGYLWLATGAGLVRFDGAGFASVATGAGMGGAVSLLVDADGDLWVGLARGGLARRHDGVIRPVPLPAREPLAARFNALAQDGEGALWIATEGAGVLRYRQGELRRFGVEDGLPSAEVAQVVATSGGHMWALAGETLAVLAGERWQVPTDLRLPSVTALAPARDGGLWVGTVWPQSLGGRGGRVFKVRDGRVETELAPYPWPQDTYATRITSLLEDGAGRVWLGCYGAALRVWERSGAWQELAEQGPLSRLDATCFAQDHEEHLFIGTAGGVLHQFRPRAVAALELPPGFEQNFITAACATRDGSIWLGTDGAGVLRYRDGGWTRYGPDQGLANPHVGVIMQDRGGALWVGTWGGLHRLAGERFAAEPGPDALRQVVLALAEDREGRLWAGTGGGLVRIGPEGGRVFGKEEGIDHNYIRGLAVDRNGRVWVAVTDRGLYRQDGGRFAHYGAGQWTGENTIRAVHADAGGALWIATFGHGLVRLQDGHFSQWTSRDGLPNDQLVAIEEDGFGYLWLASANGIFGCSKAHLATPPGAGRPPVLFRRFTVGDGLSSRRCSGVGQPVVARAPDGRLWFPNDHALAGFDPAQVAVARPESPVVIEEVLVDGVVQPPARDGRLRVAPGGRRFEFRFTAPDLRAPERVRFRYRLAGLDGGWGEVGAERTAVFNRLRPGTYEFRVMAGGGGNWREARPLRMVVVPRWWERRSVQAAGAGLLMAVIAAGGWGLSRVRLHRRIAELQMQRKLECERQRIAANIHDDLGASLTRITLLSELARDGAEAGGVGEEIGQIRTTAHQLAQAMDEIVWAVNPEHDTLNSLASYLGKVAQDLLGPAGVRCRLALPTDLPALPLGGQVRHNLYLAVKEVVHNAIKHAAASEVRLQLAVDAGTFTLTITDNGRGFDPAAPPPDARPATAGGGGRIASGNGLRNLSANLAAIGGACVIESRPGAGTEVRLTVPFPSPLS